MRGVLKAASVFVLSLVIVFAGCTKKSQTTPQSEGAFWQEKTELSSQDQTQQSLPVQTQAPIYVDDPKQEDLEVMQYVFDSIILAYRQNGIKEGHSAQNAETVDTVLVYFINNYAEIAGAKIENDAVHISVDNMNAATTACFSGAKVFLETPASTNNFTFENGEYVLKNIGDRGLQPYPVVRKTEKTTNGKIKTTVEFLTEDENYYYSTVVFYLVPNANDKTGKFPWSVESFENVMNAATLYEKLPFKEMSDKVKSGGGDKPYYQPIVMSYEDAGGGNVFVTAKMYKYDDSKGVDIFNTEVDHDYTSGDDNDGLYKFTLTENGGKYVVKNSEKI